MIMHHFVVLKGKDGKVEFHRMKQWLRQNPEFIPQGMDPKESTSHMLRAGLQNKGWKRKDVGDRVYMVRPENNDTSYVDGQLDDEAIENEGGVEEQIEEAEEITFGLERDMQSALRANIESLEPGLHIIDGGKERKTEAGNVDITARDSKGTTVVIELKAGTAPTAVITQILAYMGAVSEEEHKPVRGILVAEDFPNKVVLAARPVSSLTLNKYAIQFKFKPVQ